MRSETRKSRSLPLMFLIFTLIGSLLLSACGSFGVQVQSDGEDGFTVTGGGQADDGGDTGTIDIAPDNSGGDASADGSTMNTNTVLLIAVGLAILLAILALVVAGSRRERNPS
ncbi:MAG: hypothetical protein EPO32_00750 [Anaerolineae bacterium]|nr:MAG: hypothetical protein EPO32_00750 [Anaerolineae bacterium]